MKGKLILTLLIWIFSEPLFSQQLDTVNIYVWPGRCNNIKSINFYDSMHQCIGSLSRNDVRTFETFPVPINSIGDTIFVEVRHILNPFYKRQYKLLVPTVENKFLQLCLGRKEIYFKFYDHILRFI